MMKTVTVWSSEIIHFRGNLEVPDGLNKEEEYDWVCNNLPFDVAQDCGEDFLFYMTDDQRLKQIIIDPVE